jgi:hypothetical protein
MSGIYAEPPAMPEDRPMDATPDPASHDVLGAAPGKPLSPAARRALEEALARRAQAVADPLPGEDGGPSGLEPTRFGDWERKGLAVDF